MAKVRQIRNDRFALLRGMGWNGLVLLSLVLSLGSTGCRSFLRSQAMKDYPVQVKPLAGLPDPNPYQEDFLYLKTLGEEVFPLEDRYFPPHKRAAMETDLLRKLGEPACSHETFLFCLEEYLGAFSNEHARIIENPTPSQFTGFYPFRVHFVGNELFVSDVATNYDRSLIGQRITAINDHPVAEVEEKLSALASAENPWTKRTSLEQSPFALARPDLYQFVGLTSSVSNSVRLELADHEPLCIAPTWNRDASWSGVQRPPHPITARSQHQYDCQIFPEHGFAYLQFNACFDKTAILEGLSMIKPWIRPLVRAWLGMQFHRKKPFDVLRGIYDPERPVFIEYLTKAMGEINAAGITNLIVDLRHNGGGDGTLTTQLLYYLTGRDDLRDARGFYYNTEALAYYDPQESGKFRSWYLKEFGTAPLNKQLLPMPEKEGGFFASITNRESAYYIPPDRPFFSGKIIVLANQNTGSAAAHLTALMQDNGLARIVGTTTASNPTGPTGMTPLKLPLSGILVSMPSEYRERAEPSNGEVLQPDCWLENSVADLQMGRDAAFDKALALLSLDHSRLEPLADEELETALAFLKSLKKRGEQPGWSKEDRGVAYLKDYSYFAPRSITFTLQKEGSAFSCHYTVEFRAGSWELRRAWRTDKKGRTVEEFQ